MVPLRARLRVVVRVRLSNPGQIRLGPRARPVERLRTPGRKKDPYDPEDAIFAAARYLRASGAPGNWHDAIFAYNHAEWYVERIMGACRRFRGAGMELVAGARVGEACSPSIDGKAMLHHAERLFRPRTFKTLPSRLWVGGGALEQVDARLWPDAVWLLETYDLRVTAAREGGHQTHGDGTAMDMRSTPTLWQRSACSPFAFGSCATLRSTGASTSATLLTACVPPSINL